MVSHILQIKDVPFATIATQRLGLVVASCDFSQSAIRLEVNGFR